MSLRTTPTIAICLAAGLAGGIALARPADSDPAPAASAEPVSATVDDSTTSESGDGRYGSSDASSDEVDLGSDPYAGLGDAASDAVAEPADEPAAAETVSIDIEGFAFAGATTAAPGSTLTVTNLDSAPHSVTADDGSFDSGVLDQNGAATFTLPNESGSYSFFCIVHPSMTGEMTIG